MYLAQNLKYMRERNGEMQKDIADFLSVSKPTAGRYESGECEPDIRKLIALADHFGVTIDDLLRKDLRQPMPMYARNLKYLRKKDEKPEMEKVLRNLEELEKITQNLRVWIKKNL